MRIFDEFIFEQNEFLMWWILETKLT